MFQKLVNHNDDIRRLVDKGYAVGFDSNCLIVRDIPYLDKELQLQAGAIVAKIEFVNDRRIQQTDHQIFFAGSVPHGLDAKPLPNMGGGEMRLPLSDACKDVVVQRSFSNKPIVAGKFADFFEKIESYVAIISGPAIEKHRANPFTFRTSTEVAHDPVFKFQDTLTSRAEIAELSAKFKDDVIAVIGLGGTGAYILDFVVKTPVREIRGFDLDAFHVHNAFRSPGRLDPAELGKAKAEVYASRYDNFRKGLSVTPKFVDATCSDDLNGVTFAFVCVDKGSSRTGIFDVLISKGIPFIDVGLGLNRKQGTLDGMLRATYYSSEDGKTTRDEGLAEMADGAENLYKTNIQIAELNALNAALAVVRFKQLRGFYHQEASSYHLLLEIADLSTARLPEK